MDKERVKNSPKKEESFNQILKKPVDRSLAHQQPTEKLQYSYGGSVGLLRLDEAENNMKGFNNIERELKYDRN